MRTDRSLDFFSDVNIQNVFTLERILKTFVILRPEIGAYIYGCNFDPVLWAFRHVYTKFNVLEPMQFII